MVCDDWFWKFFIGLVFKGYGMMLGFRSFLVYSLGVKGFKILSMIIMFYFIVVMVFFFLFFIRRKYCDIFWYICLISLVYFIFV